MRGDEVLVKRLAILFENHYWQYLLCNGNCLTFQIERSVETVSFQIYYCVFTRRERFCFPIL